MANVPQKPSNFPEMIAQLETKLQSFGSGPYTDAQREEMKTLHLLLTKAKQENQKTPLPPGQTALYQVKKPEPAPLMELAAEPKLLDRKRLQDLVREVDPMTQLEDDVEEVMLQIADDFIDNVVNGSCDLAKHRKSDTLEVKDVHLYLDRGWNLWVPGFGSDELRPYKRAPVTEAHKQRMAHIKKHMKKF